MPKSKRSKIVHLTKVKKKDRSSREKLVSEIRETLENHDHVYVIEIENEKNAHLQTIRQKLKPGRMFLGKNKVMQVALGTEFQNEAARNIHQIAKLLHGHRGLLFSNLAPSEVRTIFDEHQPEEFAKSGFIATRTILLKEGPESLSQFSHSMEPQLRKLGLPTLLKSSVIYLMGNTPVCTEGTELTVEAAQLLKLLGVRMAPFRMRLVAVWTKTTRELETFIV